MGEQRRHGVILKTRWRHARRRAPAREAAAAAAPGGLDDPAGHPAATDRGQPGTRAPQRQGTTLSRPFEIHSCAKTAPVLRSFARKSSSHGAARTWPSTPRSRPRSSTRSSGSRTTTLSARPGESWYESHRSTPYSPPSPQRSNNPPSFLPQAKLSSSNDEITRLKIRLAAHDREREKHDRERPRIPPSSPEPEQDPEPEPTPRRHRRASKPLEAPAAAATPVRSTRIDVADDPDDVWAFIEEEQREFPRAPVPATPANTPVATLQPKSFNPTALWADSENLVPPARPRHQGTPQVAARVGLRERAKNVSYVEPNLKDKVRRPWSPPRPKRKSSKSKKEPETEPGTDSGGGGDIISRVASAARVAAAAVLPSPSRQPGSSVSFVTERKRGGPVGGRKFEGPAASPESPTIDPAATSRRGLTDDSDSDPDDGFEFGSGSGSDARPSPFSNFTARHGRGDSGRKGPTNR